MSSRHVVKYGRSMELKLFYAEGKNDEICPHGRFRIALASFVDICIKLIIPLIDLGRSHVSYVLYGRWDVKLYPNKQNRTRGLCALSNTLILMQDPNRSSGKVWIVFMPFSLGVLVYHYRDGATIRGKTLFAARLSFFISMSAGRLLHVYQSWHTPQQELAVLFPHFAQLLEYKI